MEKYTVIIPTRDRAETLGPTLRTCLRQTYKNFEIIVSDNCSSDNTHELVKCIGDSRVRYINPGKRLSMAGNFEFALGHVNDGFVMFIGSDDGVMPDAIEYVDSIVRHHKVDAVACRQASYVWPNFLDTEIAGRLIFGGWRNDIEIRRSSEWIRKTLDFEVHYCFELPNLYCGFVHKRVIDKAYKDGKYFRSITPDAYSAFATAIFVDEYAFSHRPFSIAGASPKSNGASALHPSADSAESNKFQAENDIEFAAGFVNCPSFEVILGETFAKLAEAFPEACSPYKIDYAMMLYLALKNSNGRTREEIERATAIMAQTFGIAMSRAAPRKNALRGKGAGDIRRALASMFAESKIVGIPRSDQVGINDVDDAALVAHVLGQSAPHRFTTNKELIWELMRRVFAR